MQLSYIFNKNILKIKYYTKQVNFLCRITTIKLVLKNFMQTMSFFNTISTVVY